MPTPPPDLSVVRPSRARQGGHFFFFLLGATSLPLTPSPLQSPYSSRWLDYRNCRYCGPLRFDWCRESSPLVSRSSWNLTAAPCSSTGSRTPPCRPSSFTPSETSSRPPAKSTVSGRYPPSRLSSSSAPSLSRSCVHFALSPRRPSAHTYLGFAVHHHRDWNLLLGRSVCRSSSLPESVYSLSPVLRFPLTFCFAVARPRGQFLGRVRIHSDTEGPDAPLSQRDVYVPQHPDGVRNPHIIVEAPPPGVIIYRFEEAFVSLFFPR